MNNKAGGKMSYQGAVNTGGFPSLEMQQYSARQNIKATLSTNPNAASLRGELNQNRAMLAGLKWFDDMVNFTRPKDTLTPSDYAKLSAMVNGWAYTIQEA